MLDLRRISHLVALADERHFGRAAERVHLSQPAFSRSIQALEGLAGHRLFDRGSSEVRPTPAGSFLIQRARALLADARHLERDLTLFGDSQLGDTAFGVGPLPAATLLPHALAQLRRAHPKVALRVEVNNWILLLDRLQAEDIEFFIADVRELPEDATLAVRPLASQLGGFYVRRGHPLLAARSCTLSEAWSFGFASVRLPVAVMTTLARQLGLAPGAPLTLALECDDIALLKTVALESDTVLAGTAGAVGAEVDRGELLPLQVRDLPRLESRLGLASLRNRTPSPMAQHVIARIEAHLTRTPSGAPRRTAGTATRSP